MNEKRYEINKVEEKMILQGEGFGLYIKKPNFNVKVFPNDGLEDAEIEITIKAKGKRNLENIAPKLFEEAVKVDDIEFLEYLSTVNLSSKSSMNKVFEYGDIKMAEYFGIKLDLPSLIKAIKYGNENIVQYILENSDLKAEEKSDYVVEQAMCHYHDSKTVDILLNMEISIAFETLKRIEKYCDNAEKGKLLGIVRD